MIAQLRVNMLPVGRRPADGQQANGPRARGRLFDGRTAKGLVQALPLVLVAGLVVYLVEHEGGFDPTSWYPAALIMLAVAVTVAFSAGRLLLGAPRVTYAAIGCLAAFSVWSFASIGWAAVRGDAWAGSNRGLLYLLGFALLASWPASTRAVWPVLLLLGLVVAVEGIVTAERAASAADPTQFLIGTRLSEPLGYPNATAALFMTMAWLMVGLASRPWLPAPARGFAFGLAGMNCTLNLLSESRGSIFTLPLVVAAYFLFVPGRLRSVATLGVVAVGMVPVIGPMRHLWNGGEANVQAALQHTIDVGLITAAALALGGWLLASVDQRRRWSPRAVKIGAAVVISGAVLAGAAVVGATSPWAHVGSAWHSFKYSGEPTGTASRFGGLGSNRYDFWRVGLIEFERHPIQGIGTDNFLVPYLQLRRSGEEPQYPHSLAVRLLSQSGIVGSALFAGFLAFTIVSVKRIAPGRRRELACVLAVAASVWLLHGLVDWLWEMPVLGVLGMALLGAACGLAPREKQKPNEGLSRVPRAVAVCGVVATVAVLATLVPPWLAERDVQRAAAQWQQDPAGAFATLDRANRLNPLADEADLVGGAIASRLHRYVVMRNRFQDAVTRSPDDWYAQLELGIAASLTGQHGLAAYSLGRARQLDPGDPILRSVLKTFAAGRRIDSDAVDRAFAAAQ